MRVVLRLIVSFPLVELLIFLVNVNVIETDLSVFSSSKEGPNTSSKL